MKYVKNIPSANSSKRKEKKRIYYLQTTKTINIKGRQLSYKKKKEKRKKKKFRTNGLTVDFQTFDFDQNVNPIVNSRISGQLGYGDFNYCTLLIR